MRYWLFKSEPSTWSWDDQVAKGETGEEWDGVRNYQDMILVRNSRLSVQPVTEDEWQVICSLGNTAL